MSRNTYYRDDRITVITGVDHMLGQFYQVYDRNMQNETPEGEGIVLDWSEQFGYETNLTGIPNKPIVLDVINKYVEENMNTDESIEVNLN